MSRNRTFLLIASAASFLTTAALAAPKGVQVVPDQANRRVNITIDGQPFTSYIWPTRLKKPILFPIIDAEGTTITRGWPLAPRPGERTDHPHHDGLWFNYSNVNGFDFWNNSEAIPPQRAPKMGTILFDKIVSAKSGATKGELVTDSTWIDGNNHPILADTTRYVFVHVGSTRSIDLIVTLKALDRVVFNDDKDGLLGLRVARWLESPEEKGGTFTDANGVATKVAAAADIPGVASPTGEYLTSEGVKGEAAWSTRGRWCSLTGHDDAGHTVTIAIFDHPGNVNYPTYWHARGYGLFAANPLGQHMFDPKQSPLNYTLEKGQSTTFRYSVVIYTHAATTEGLNHEADAFAAQYVQPMAIMNSESHSEPVHLRCENLENPLGIDAAVPRLSWQSDSKERDWRQSAYEILVGSTQQSVINGRPDIRDSGRQFSAESVDVPYSGPKLKSEKCYYWSVRVWDAQGRVSRYAAPAWWEMGLLRKEDWIGDWVAWKNPEDAADLAGIRWIWAAGRNAFDESPNLTAVFHLNVDITGKPVNAALYVAARGTLVAKVNGQVVATKKHWQEFDRADVTTELVAGKNELEVTLTSAKLSGYAFPVSPSGKGGSAGLAALLKVQYPGARIERFPTNDSWNVRMESDAQWKSAQIVADLNWPTDECRNSLTVAFKVTS